MQYYAASLLLCTNFTWLCASFGAEQRKMQVEVQREKILGRCRMAVINI